jgi:N-acetylglucosamine kinase-like BadF-type ATPase
MMTYFLGVDAGNTKTIALVAKQDGTIIGSGRGGCGDIYGASTPEAAIEQIERAVENALKQAGVSASEISSGGFSLAGADWRSDFEYLQGEMSKRGYGKEIRIYNDAIGALRAGSPDGTGVVIACGTGTAIGARSASGKIWHGSFWQEPLCGEEMGSRALRAIYRAELGVDPPTGLTAAVLKHFDEPSAEQMLYRFTAQGMTHPTSAEVAKLSRVVLDEAANGDTAALKIAKELGRELANYALAAARQVGLDGAPFTLVLNGGVFRHDSTTLLDAVLEQLRASGTDVNVVSSELEPAAGALLLAFEAGKIPVDATLLAKLEASLPPPELFHT